MSEHVVMTLPASARTTDDTRVARRAPRLVRAPVTEHDDGRAAVGLVERGSAAADLAGPELARLQQVLEDVRFSLERGAWQAALATVHAALTPRVGSNR